MGSMSHTASLSLIKVELDELFDRVGGRLEQLTLGHGDRGELTALCADIFQQLHGIFRLLEIPAATLMATAMEQLIKAIEGNEQAGATNTIAVSLGHGVALLQKYIDYIRIKNNKMPELVIEALNELRLLSAKAPIPDSHFFSVKLDCERPYVIPATGLLNGEVDKRIRYFRRRFQLGLLGVLRDNNPSTNLKMLLQALTHLERLTIDATTGRFLWLARGAVTALLVDNMAITLNRKRLLCQIDRHLKRSFAPDNTQQKVRVPLLLIKESVFLVSLSSSNRGVLGEIQRAFSLANDLSEQMIQQQRAALATDTGVIKAVTKALWEELKIIRQQLNLISLGAVDVDFTDVAKGLNQIANTLLITGREQDAGLISQRAEVIVNWKRTEVNAKGKPFLQFVDSLLVVENAINLLERQLLPNEALYQPANSTDMAGISLHQIDDARRAALRESRTSLAIVKQAMDSYSESRNLMHLTNLPQAFSHVSGSMVFLALPRSKSVLASCSQVIEKALAKGQKCGIEGQQLSALADAITCVDYYLESLELRKPIGVPVLDLAEQSLEAFWPLEAHEI